MLNSTHYIIGGLVDHNRLKFATLNQAQSEGSLDFYMKQIVDNNFRIESDKTSNWPTYCFKKFNNLVCESW